MTQPRTAETFAERYPGLSSAEVAERAQASGTNRFQSESTRSYTRIVIDNAFPAANVALMAVAVVLIALGLYVDALFTAGLVVGNIVVGVFQETRAKRQLDRIAVLARAKARVIRDGCEQEIDPDDLVQDDVVVIAPGDQVQADGTVLAAERCSLDESLLTGESDLVRKGEGDTVYSGSFCMSGQAVYRCDQIGSASFANQITARARGFRVVRTPLQREVGYVMWGMAIVVALMSVEILASFRSIYGEVPLRETTRAAAVIVALIPQGLWVMVTVTYGLAIVRMSPLGTLVQRLNAVESISHVDVLCLDKTGTITTNALTLEGLHPLGVSEHELRGLLGAYCSSASISNRTNDAIAHAMPADAVPVAGEVHFDSSRKWSALLFEGGGAGVYVLGAPEVLLPHATKQDSAGLLASWSQRGLRVLLFGVAKDARSITYSGDDPQLPERLEPLGFVILRDELRAGARETIAEFARAGITLKIISGDNPETVAALARDAGVSEVARAVSGLDFDAEDERRVDDLAREATVFGRITPPQKARIVEALQRQGHYVAMIGDGVNDVPALKRAQVAISVRSASPVTRSVADIILMDDSFSALPRAFVEGRRIRSGMEAVIRLFLVRTLAITLVIIAAGALRSEFPLSPRHTAILSTLTVGVPALFIAAWAQPRFTARYLIASSAAFVAPAATLMGIMGIIVYEVVLHNEPLIAARTALTAAGVLGGALLIPYVDDLPEKWMRLRALADPPRTAALAAATVVLFAVAMASGWLRDFYELHPLGVWSWLFIIGAVAAWAVALGVAWRLLAGRIDDSVRRVTNNHVPET